MLKKICLCLALALGAVPFLTSQVTAAQTTENSKELARVNWNININTFGGYCAPAPCYYPYYGYPCCPPPCPYPYAYPAPYWYW